MNFALACHFAVGPLRDIWHLLTGFYSPTFSISPTVSLQSCSLPCEHTLLSRPLSKSRLGTHFLCHLCLGPRTAVYSLASFWLYRFLSTFTYSISLSLLPSSLFIWSLPAFPHSGQICSWDAWGLWRENGQTGESVTLQRAKSSFCEEAWSRESEMDSADDWCV